MGAHQFLPFGGVAGGIGGDGGELGPAFVEALKPGFEVRLGGVAAIFCGGVLGFRVDTGGVVDVAVFTVGEVDAADGYAESTGGG